MIWDLLKSKYRLFIVLSIMLGMSVSLLSLDPLYDAATLPPAWLEIRHEFALDHQAHSERVHIEIQKWLADPERLNRILEASTPYIYFIYQQTQAKGLPAELALIPVVESEFNPNDRSRKGAVGLWQLMPQTARELGVNTSGHDGRRNVTISTQAALTYLKDLGELFNGNWLLAIAAYNSGQMKVTRATRRAGTDDFWDLEHLPRETKIYVPRLLAIAEIVEHPHRYGVQLPTV